MCPNRQQTSSNSQGADGCDTGGLDKKGHIPVFDFWNKTNPTADPVQCERYRPNFVYEWAEDVLLLEYDEQTHSDRNKRCELVHMAEASLGSGWLRGGQPAISRAPTTGGRRGPADSRLVAFG